MNTPLYSLRNITKTRVRDWGYTLSIPAMDIYPGELIGITGPSGSGKSTALDLLGLALKPDMEDNASFLFCTDNGVHNVLDFWRKGNNAALADLRLRHLSYVIQTGGLFPFLSVAENMALTAQANNTPNRNERVNTVAEQLRIADLLNQRPGTLSVGERQRVAIGRALVSCPHVILADEPTAALDPVNARDVMRLLVDAVRTVPQVTLIVVSHDAELFDLGDFRRLHVEVLSRSTGGVTAMIQPDLAPADTPRTDVPFWEEDA